MTIKYIIPIGKNNGTNKTFIKFIDKIIKQKGLDIFISDEAVEPEKELKEKIQNEIEKITKVIPKEKSYFLVFNEKIAETLSTENNQVKNINEILDFINSVPQDISATFQTIAPYIDGYLQTRLSLNKEQQKQD
jgi:hypothetical protein